MLMSELQDDRRVPVKERLFCKANKEGHFVQTTELQPFIQKQFKIPFKNLINSVGAWSGQKFQA